MTASVAWEAGTLFWKNKSSDYVVSNLQSVPGGQIWLYFPKYNKLLVFVFVYL